MQVAEEKVQRWMRKLRGHCHRWCHHPEFDDILGSAYERAALALVSLPESATTDPEAIFMRAGWLGAMDFLRSRRSWHRTYQPETHLPVPRPVSLEALSRRGWTGKTPDFAPALIQRLAAAALWAEASACLPPERRRFLELVIGHGCEQREALKAIGEDSERGKPSDRLRTGLVHCRRALGLLPPARRKATLHRRGPALTPDDLPRIEARLAAGESYKNISADYGRRPETLRHYTWKSRKKAADEKEKGTPCESKDYARADDRDPGADGDHGHHHGSPALCPRAGDGPGAPGTAGHRGP